jgi:hypothetical protein
VLARSFAFLGFATLLVAGCSLPTSFKGEPKVPGGAAGCQTRCTALGMELAGMVVMGEYSDGCVCRVKEAATPSAPAPAPAPAPPPAPASSGPTGALAPGESLDVGSPAVVGVAVQLWARDEHKRAQIREQQLQFWGR